MSSPDHSSYRSTSPVSLKNSKNVSITTEKKIYFPGETIIGRVSIKNLSNIRTIQLHLKGETKVTVLNRRKNWSGNGLALGPASGTGAIPVTFDQHHTILTLSQNLFVLGEDCKNGRPAEDSAPTHMELPFAFELPTHQQDERPDIPLPSTFWLPVVAQKRLEVSYFLEADVKRNGLTKPNKKEIFPVVVKTLTDELPLYEDTKTTLFTVPLGYTGTPLWLQVEFTTPRRLEVPINGDSFLKYSARFTVVTEVGHEPPHDSVLSSLRPLFKTYLLRRTITRPERPLQGEEWRSTGEGILQGTCEIVQGESKSGENLMEGSIKVGNGEIDVKSTCCEVGYVVALQVTGERIKGVGMTRNPVSFVYVPEEPTRQE